VNTQYEDYWHQAMELKHQTHDLINDHEHPMAHALQHETTELVDDIELDRHPRSIEDRIRRIQHQLLEARSQGEKVLSYDHNHHLHQHYDHMRQGIRRLPHY
jgi:hypothetical protein